MPILNEFEYLKPQSISEALKLLSKHKAAQVLAGGTDLVGNLKEGAGAVPSLVMDIKGLRELKKIEVKSGSLHIGALVTFSEVIDSKVIAQKFPVLCEIAKKVASVGIRNRATLVGNICSAVPCLDSGPVLVAMGGFVHVKSTKGARKIPAEKWFVHARKTSKKPSELVLGISLPLPKSKWGACYVKLGRYQGEDLAQASCFVALDRSLQYRVAFGSVAPVPRRAHRVEKILNKKKLSAEVLAQAKNAIPSEISPITDIRATKEYRLHMCQIMMERALGAAQTRLAGQGPAYGVSVI